MRHYGPREPANEYGFCEHCKKPVRVIRGLTKQEIIVGTLIAQGKSRKQIAEKLCLSPRTVDTHRRSIRIKLQVPWGENVVWHITQWASREGLVNVEAES